MANKEIPDDRDIETILLEYAEGEREEELSFDRFMVGVVDEQTRKNTMVLEEESPLRKFNRRYREKAANRIRYTR